MNSERVILQFLFLLTSSVCAMPSAQTHARHAQKEWRRGTSGELSTTGQQQRSIIAYPGTSVVRLWTEQKRPPPTYFTLLFQQVSSSSEEILRGQGSEGEGTLLRTLLPFKLTYGGGHALVVSFNLTSLGNLGDFHSAEIILTLLRKERKGRSRFHLPESKTAYDDLDDPTAPTLSIKSSTEKMEMEGELEMRGRNVYGLDATSFLKEVERRELGILQLEMELTRTNPEAGTDEPIPVELFFQLHSQNAPFILFHQTQFDISDRVEGLRRKRSIIPAGGSIDAPEKSAHSPVRSPPLLEPQSESGSRCHKEEWLVRPGDIGLDDILAPDFLDLGYCAGECPFPLLNGVYNFSLHSYFIDRHRILRGLQATPGKLRHSSCVAVSYKPLMIMEEGLSGQLVSIHKNALVQACGCRY